MSTEETWNDFIQKEIIQNGNATHCALISVSDAGIWAKTDNFVLDANLKGDEVPSQWLESVLSTLENPNPILGSNDVSSECIPLLNKQFVVTRVIKDKVICGKNGVDGCYIFKTNEALIVVVYGISNEPGECYLDCENFARYMITQGL